MFGHYFFKLRACHIHRTPPAHPTVFVPVSTSYDISSCAIAALAVMYTVNRKTFVSLSLTSVSTLALYGHYWQAELLPQVAKYDRRNTI
jgi:hypothetical protein